MSIRFAMRALLFCFLTGGALSAQTFQAASVKPNLSGDFRIRFIPDAPGRFVAENVPAELLIRFAYNIPDFFNVSGAPGWINTDRFDIAASMDGNPSLTDRRLMLQHLFEERFTLTAHHDTRQLQIYAMRLSSRNGALGPHLRRSSADCSTTAMLPLLPGRAGSPGPVSDTPCGFFGMSPTANLPSGRGGLAFRGLTMAALAEVWTVVVRRTVVDQTGLTGYFDGEFDFIAEMPPPPPPPGLPNPFTTPFASVFSVVPDQLGLKLDGDRGPVDVLVIDGIQHPTAD